MARHNLGTVVSFEVTRTLTKRRFWIATLIVPVILGIVIGLVTLSNSVTSASVDSQKSAKFTFSYTDASGLVNPSIVKAIGGTKATDPSAAIAAVKSGKLDAFFAYPENPTKEPTDVYGVDQGIFNNGKYSSVATQILVASAQAKIGDQNLTTLAQGNLIRPGFHAAGLLAAPPVDGPIFRA
jgi:ABC-2 type transport system permease protein